MNDQKTGPYDIGDEVHRAIKEKNEGRLKELIVLAMRYFLDGELDDGSLAGCASLYIKVPVELGWNTNFEFNSPDLQKVFEELTAIDGTEEKEAREIVEGLLKLLEGELN